MSLFKKELSCFLYLWIFLFFAAFIQPVYAENSSFYHSVDEEMVLAGNTRHSHHGRPDDHAPITVMGDHVHNQGEWMLSYRYMLMKMSGSKKGSNSVKNSDILADFPITPTDMTMQMHMLSLMAAPSDHVTFALMLPIIRKDMDHRNRAGLTFRTHSEGIGDLRLSALVPIYEKEFKKSRHQVHLNLGLSFPIGEIDEKADLPIGTDRRLPYPMQLGSGTWDLHPGLTYNGQTDNWSWGAQHVETIRPGRNRIGYSLGNLYETTIWGSRKWSDWVSNSVGIKWSIWQNIGGRDPLQIPAMVPTADTQSRGGKRFDFLFGINFYVPKGFLKGQRLALDFGIPFAQSLDGPQLETDWYMTAGWQASFG